jgi:hypothetical protein
MLMEAECPPFGESGPNARHAFCIVLEMLRVEDLDGASSARKRGACRVTNPSKAIGF